MGKDLRGKELGRGISKREDGLYVARYTNKYGKRVQKVLPKLQELRQWLADAQYKEEHSNIDFPDAMTVNAWFEYWIGIKKRTVRPNTVRNYTERYQRNIEPIIGNKMLGSVNTIHCQTIMNRMADEGYRTSTIYQTRIALLNMLDYAYQNDVILNYGMGIVFLCKKGTPVKNSTYDTLLFKLCDKAGIDRFSMHVLRLLLLPDVLRLE